MLKPLMQSLRVLPHSTRQFVSEHDWVQSMYCSSHWPSHFAAISLSLETHFTKLDNTGEMPTDILTGRFWEEPIPGN